MFRTPGASRRLSGVAVAIVTAGLLIAAAPGGRSVPPAGAGPAACGSSTVATVAAADAAVTTGIYRNELASTEVTFDLAQITGAADLLAAVAMGDRTATLRAVARIVFHPAWHIVRLRVLDASGRILAEIGGPYVIAPVPGVLRSGGRRIGSFVMSVQDDVGVTKLEVHFVGDPIGIYLGGKLVAERGANLPVRPPTGTTLILAGTNYHVVAQAYRAFPTGMLTAVILVAPPAPALTKQTCAAVRAGEFGRIAVRFARLAPTLPEHYPGYATTVRNYTGAEVFVRDGARQLASSGGSGPAVIPTSGTVSDRGKSWLVFSFEPRPPTRVYVLIPPA